MYCCMPSVLHIFVPESKLLLTLFICSTPPHDCLQFHDFTYCAVAVLVVVMAVIVYFPFLTFCSTNRTCFLTTKEQTYSKINAIFDSCICIVFKERALNYQGDQSYTHTHIHIITYIHICCGLNLVLVQNFENWFNFYFLLSYIHYHSLEQWQIKLKPVQITLNQG